MPPQSRIVDNHKCTVPPPAFVAPFVTPCSTNVMVNFMPAARALVDQTTTGSPPVPPAPHPFVKGSLTVQINFMQALRIGDPCALGGNLILGSPNVMTGG